LVRNSWFENSPIRPAQRQYEWHYPAFATFRPWTWCAR
jgi:hypothetical protein